MVLFGKDVNSISVGAKLCGSKIIVEEAKPREGESSIQ